MPVLGHCRRDIVDAIRYLVKEGICWRAMPADLPPWQTVYAVLDHWQDSGATEAMHGELRRQCRIAAGRKPKLSAAVIDSQSVKAAETVARHQATMPAGLRAGRPETGCAALSGSIGLAGADELRRRLGRWRKGGCGRSTVAATAAAATTRPHAIQKAR